MAKIGFIGTGNMGRAMVKGLAQSGLYQQQDLYVYDRNLAVAKELAQDLGIQSTETPQALVKACDRIIFAVKPNVLPAVLRALVPEVTADKVVISVAAGISLEKLASILGADHKIVRVMPNTPALVGMGMSAVTQNDQVTQAELAEVLAIFASFGKAEAVSEFLIDAVVGVSGSAPAYVYLFIEALADGAVMEGMPRAQAYEFAAQTVMGSAQMVLETGQHPGELKDMVCSPGGTTIAAVKTLEEAGFRAAVIQAVQVAAEKNREMAEKNAASNK